MTHFKLRPSKEELLEAAARYTSGDEAPVEIGAAAWSKGYYNVDQLVAMRRWKNPRGAKRATRNEENFTKMVTQIAFGIEHEELKISILRLLKGVSWPTASVLMHFGIGGFRYPILDKDALWSLGLDKAPKYDFEFWSDYTSFARELAAYLSIDLRTLDRGLWQFAKENR